MELLNHNRIKHSFTTRIIPLDRMAGVTPFSRPPRIGDLVLAEVVHLGKNTTLEDRSGLAHHIFAGDMIIGAFGNRYATDQYEGFVPKEPVETCALLSMGGVCGVLVAKHGAIANPTQLRIIGAVCGWDGSPLSQRDFGLQSAGNPCKPGEVILVVGASMNAGKTTTVGMLVRALRLAGKRVAAAKVTGTAASKDLRFFESCGAYPALDFTAAGYPSTYLLSYAELMEIYYTLLSQVQSTSPDYVVIEIADGIFQRETRMLLESDEFRSTIDHLLFAANDSLSAESGERHLRKLNLPLRAITGKATQSPLLIREIQEVTQTPCLTIEQILDGLALELLILEASQTRKQAFDAYRHEAVLA